LAVRNYLENRREERDSVCLLSYMKIESGITEPEKDIEEE